MAGDKFAGPRSSAMTGLSSGAGLAGLTACFVFPATALRAIFVLRPARVGRTLSAPKSPGYRTTGFLLGRSGPSIEAALRRMAVVGSRLIYDSGFAPPG